MDVDIYRISPKQADTLEGFMSADAINAIREGLPVTAFAAVIDGIIVGALVGVIDEECFVLDSIYVLREYRRKGIGTRLLNVLEDILEGEGYYIKASYSAIGEDEIALKSFLVRNFFVEEENNYPKYLYGTLFEAMTYDKILRSKAIDKYKISPLSQVEPKLFNAVISKANHRDIPFPKGGFYGESVVPDISMCVLDKESVKAYIIIEHMKDGMIEVSALWSSLEDPRIMMRMIMIAVTKTKEKYGDDTPIVIVALNPVSEKIAKTIIRHIRTCSYTYVKL